MATHRKTFAYLFASARDVLPVYRTARRIAEAPDTKLFNNYAYAAGSTREVSIRCATPLLCTCLKPDLHCVCSRSLGTRNIRDTRVYQITHPLGAQVFPSLGAPRWSSVGRWRLCQDVDHDSILCATITSRCVGNAFAYMASRGGLLGLMMAAVALWGRWARRRVSTRTRSDPGDVMANEIARHEALVTTPIRAETIRTGPRVSQAKAAVRGAQCFVTKNSRLEQEGGLDLAPWWSRSLSLATLQFDRTIS
jgi:hypothetical protein